MNAAQQILSDALAYVERGHTTETLARTASGRPCRPTSRKAVCWCAMGAMEAATGERLPTEAWMALRDAAVEFGWHRYALSALNDSAPERVPALFARAIVLAGRAQ